VGLRPADEQALRAPHPLGRPHFQGIPMNPTNSDRRYVLLEQHAKLRMTIETARTSARKALAQRGSAGAMKAAVAALQRDLLAHLADEEKLLEPILPQLDAWGPVRLDLLRAEHAHQRAVLAVLTGHEASPAVTVVAGRTLAICDDLLADMEFEERELLNENVLRDDFILLDASDC
jgi:iron-sulfur cluster repair protein YtfE (RIC family)